MERHSSFGSPRSCKWSSFRDRLRPRMSHSRSDSVHRFSWFLPTEGGSYLFSKSAHSPQRVKTGKAQNEHIFSGLPRLADVRAVSPACFDHRPVVHDILQPFWRAWRALVAEASLCRRFPCSECRRPGRSKLHRHGPEYSVLGHLLGGPRTDLRLRPL